MPLLYFWTKYTVLNNPTQILHGSVLKYWLDYAHNVTKLLYKIYRVPLHETIAFWVTTKRNFTWGTACHDLILFSLHCIEVFTILLLIHTRFGNVFSHIDQGRKTFLNICQLQTYMFMFMYWVSTNDIKKWVLIPFG